jgi:CO/xanthine dehydrogenase FAD-binding subunit
MSNKVASNRTASGDSRRRWATRRERMMIRSYHRPQSIEEALRLLARGGVKTAALPALSLVDAQLDDSVDEVVDLQAVGLNQIRADGATLIVQAQVTLQALLEHPAVSAPLRDILRHEEPNTLRNMRTLSSVILCADAESPLVAALLACDAQVSIQTLSGSRQMPLTDFLKDANAALAGGLVTDVLLDQGSALAVAQVARTPADKPIVAAVGRRDAAGQVRLALCGVASVPVLVDPQQLDALNPPADFRGSSAYRQEMAAIVSRRVLESLEQAS